MVHEEFFLCPKSATKNSWCHCRCDFFLTHLKGFLQVPSTLVQANWPKVFLLRDFISTPKIHQDRGLPQSLETTLKNWVETLYHQNNLKPLMFFVYFFLMVTFGDYGGRRYDVPFKTDQPLGSQGTTGKVGPVSRKLCICRRSGVIFFTVDGGCWVATKVEPRVLRKAFLPP